MSLSELQNASRPFDKCYWGMRQQWGLHGPASGGGHAEVIGRLPEETRPTDALISFSIRRDPHLGQAGFSVRDTRSSTWLSHASHWNSNKGIHRS